MPHSSIVACNFLTSAALTLDGSFRLKVKKEVTTFDLLFAKSSRRSRVRSIAASAHDRTSARIAGRESYLPVVWSAISTLSSAS